MVEQTVHVYPQYPHIYGYFVTWQVNGDEAGSDED